MASFTKNIFSLRHWNQVFLLGLVIISAACSDNSNAKRNSNQLFRIDIRSGNCHEVSLQKSFTTQRDLCEYVAYEARTNNCLYNELRNEYNRYNCQYGSYDVYPVNGGPVGGPVQTIPDSPVVPQQPIIDRNIWNDMYQANLSLLSYYSVDESGCFAKIHNTTDVIDLCVDGRPTGNEKDAEYNPNLPSMPPKPEKDEVYIPGPSFPEKDQASNPTPSTPKPSTPAPTNPSTPSPSTPAPSTPGNTPPPAPTVNQLAYSLISYNSKDLMIESVSAQRIPILKITGSIDSKSPIYNRRHKNPTNFLSIKQISVPTTNCPLKAQVSSSTTTLSVTLLPEAGSNATQMQACRVFFENLTKVSAFDIEFADSLVMTTGAPVSPSFKFVSL